MWLLLCTSQQRLVRTKQGCHPRSASASLSAHAADLDTAKVLPAEPQAYASPISNNVRTSIRPAGRWAAYQHASKPVYVGAMVVLKL